MYALYNCNKKELVGVFRTLPLIAMYISKTKDHTKLVSRLSRTWVKRGKMIRNTGLDFVITVRTATPSQERLVVNEAYIVPSYPQPKTYTFTGFTKLNSVHVPRGNPNGRKPVVHIGTGETFESARCLATFLKLPYSTICYRLKGGKDFPYKYISNT